MIARGDWQEVIRLIWERLGLYLRARANIAYQTCGCYDRELIG
ncbi:MAG TPA: hypothetical protein VLG74_10430 [Blastocatellia bacterium]|nr:hypothetical protein [Blastocatellia bacterium]